MNHQPNTPASLNEGRYAFVCNAGCGVCSVKVAPFEYERTETLEGEHLGSKYQPQIVSACCGSAVHVYDNEADHWGAEVTLAAPGAAIDARECGNGECGWKGVTDRMLGSVGPLCPECGETTERASRHEAPAASAQLTDAQVMALWRECSIPTDENDHTTGPLPFARALLKLTPSEAISPATVAQAGELIYKFECFIDHATGGKLSKSSWSLETLKASHDEHLNACVEEALVEQAEESGDEASPAVPVAWRIAGSFFSALESIPVGLRAVASPEPLYCRQLYVAQPCASQGCGGAVEEAVANVVSCWNRFRWAKETSDAVSALAALSTAPRSLDGATPGGGE